MTLMVRRRRVRRIESCWPKSDWMMGRHLTRLILPWITMLRHPKNIAPNPYQLQPDHRLYRLDSK